MDNIQKVIPITRAKKELLDLVKDRIPSIVWSNNGSQRNALMQGCPSDS